MAAESNTLIGLGCFQSDTMDLENRHILLPPPTNPNPMKTPKDLSRQELERLAEAVQQALYLDYSAEEDTFYWDQDKGWEAADICADLATLLQDLSLVPEARIPFQPGH